jgi:excisionase family DNA binding protein
MEYFLTVNKAARLLGLKPHQVYYLLVMGEIEAVKVGSRLWRLVPESVRGYGEKARKRHGKGLAA